MSYQQKEKPCKYECGMTVIWKGKSGKPGSTGFFEKGTSLEHTYDRCRELKTNRGPQQQIKPSYQAQPLRQPESKYNPTITGTGYVAGSSTFPVDKEPEIRGVTINSLFVKTSNMEKEIKELRKQIETLASIADSIAQKTELVIQKIGYPGPELSQERARREIEESIPPEPIQSEAMKKLIESKEIVRTPLDPKPKTDESGVLLKDGQEIKAVQRSLSPDEVNRTDGAMQFLNKTDVMQWENLSEAFLCHNCNGKFHNGFYKLGTRLCPSCKDKVESNESEDSTDRNDVNDFNPNPRTIEEINNDERYDF